MSELERNLKRTNTYNSQRELYRNRAKFESEKRRFVDKSTRFVRVSDKLYNARGKMIGGAISLVVPLLVAVFICRMLFTNVSADVNINTLFLDILQRFGSETFSTQYLMWTLGNFSEISAWVTDSSGILEALKTIVSIFGHIGNFVLLLTALLLQALRFIGFLFSMLFVA